MMKRTREIAIVCQPWDSVASQSSNSIVTVSYQVARLLPGDWRVVIYGRRTRGQKWRETDGNTIEFKRLLVVHRPQAIFEILLGIAACYTRSRITYHLSYLYHLFYALRVAISIRASKCDIVVVHNFPQFASLIKLFNPSAAVCLHMHCEWLSHYATVGRERQLSKLDLIVGCSEFITGEVKSHFPKIAARCHTVYNGVDANSFCPAPDGPSSGTDVTRLLFVGRLIPEWGIHILIRAFKFLAETRPKLRLDIVGATNTGRYLYLCGNPKDRAIVDMVGAFYGNTFSDMVRRQLDRRGQSYLGDLLAEAAGDERIVFHGAVSHSKTIDLYRRAAMLVFPAIVHAPSPLPTYEAAAVGLPIVATLSGGITEIVEHGRTGLLVARGDVGELAAAISHFLDEPALARAIGKAGRQRVLDRFTWNASTQRLAGMIEDLSLTVPQMDIAARGETPM